VSVRTTYSAALQNEQVDPDPDDLVLAVVRKPMYGILSVVDRNVDQLAPPQDLLDAYKRVEEAAGREVAWRSVRFAQQFHEYLASDPAAQHAAARVAQHSAERTVWLVCYEADDRFCHRRLLRDFISGDPYAELAGGHIDDACDPEEHHLGYHGAAGVWYCERCNLRTQTMTDHLGQDLSAVIHR
jgi:uncharacterized protein YeaO (DUF488 family)